MSRGGAVAGSGRGRGLAADTDWDLVVIGAGPSGCAAAIGGAADGLRVLLVDRSAFPRYKVCGCCLGPRTIASLARLGVVAGVLGRPLDRMTIRGWGRAVAFPVPVGLVCSREQLDHALVRRAQDVGVRVLTECHAQPGAECGDRRFVQLRDHAGTRRVRAALVVVATGLPRDRARGRRRGERIGLGASRPALPGWEGGSEVQMSLGSSGYVGAVRLRDGRLNVAASIDREMVERLGPGAAVDTVVEAAGGSALRIDDGWRGTPPLGAAARPLAGRRLVHVGDASGFAEPFTGEGIGWALESAVRSRAAVAALSRRWSDRAARRWSAKQRRWIQRAQLRSRAVTWVARTPRLAPAVLEIASRWPRLLSSLTPTTGVARAASR